jgi:hypothetical protein
MSKRKEKEWDNYQERMERKRRQVVEIHRAEQEERKERRMARENPQALGERWRRKWGSAP